LCSILWTSAMPFSVQIVINHHQCMKQMAEETMTMTTWAPSQPAVVTKTEAATETTQVTLCSQRQQQCWRQRVQGVGESCKRMTISKDELMPLKHVLLVLTADHVSVAKGGCHKPDNCTSAWSSCALKQGCSQNSSNVSNSGSNNNTCNENTRTRWRQSWQKAWRTVLSRVPSSPPQTWQALKWLCHWSQQFVQGMLSKNCLWQTHSLVANSIRFTKQSTCQTIIC